MRKTIAILIALGLSAAQVGASEQLNLALKSKIEAKGTTVSLSEIFDTTRTSPTLVISYGQISIQVPKDSSRIIPADVLMALGRAGADLRHVTLITPSAVTIETDLASETLSLIKARALARLESESGLKEMSILFTKIPEDLPTRGSFQDISVEIREGTTADIKNVVVNFMDRGAVRSSAILEAKLEAQKTVLTAKNNLYAGMSVSAADFNVEKKSLLSAEGVISALEELGQGKWILNEAMAAGAPLKRSAVNVSATMQKGAIITLLTGDKRFQVRAMGRIKEVMDGGSSVLVENIDSKKEVVGRPLNANEVQIVY